MVAADLADRGHPPCADRAGNHADRAQQIKRPALEILAGDVFQRLPARPQIHAVAHFGIARHRTNALIMEMGNQMRNGVAGDDRIRIHADENRLVPAQMLEPEIESFGFAAVSFGQDDELPGRELDWRCLPRNFQRVVGGSVVDHDHAQVGVVGIKSSQNCSLNYYLLIKSRDEKRDVRTESGQLFAGTVTAAPQAVDDREHTDEYESPGHQNIAQEKDGGNGLHDQLTKSKGKPVNTRRPTLVGGEHRHDLRTRLAQKLTDRDQLKPASPYPIDN